MPLLPGVSDLVNPQDHFWGLCRVLAAVGGTSSLAGLNLGPQHQECGGLAAGPPGSVLEDHFLLMLYHHEFIRIFLSGSP